jgi:para-aminobenzoate synthetase component 1
MEIIAELEPVPRGFYCGSLFWQTDYGDFDSNILIRTLQARADGQLWCHGGGGITVDSNVQGEYEESLFKVQALMESVGNGE